MEDGTRFKRRKDASRALADAADALAKSDSDSVRVGTYYGLPLMMDIERDVVSQYSSDAPKDLITLRLNGEWISEDATIPEEMEHSTRIGSRMRLQESVLRSRTPATPNSCKHALTKPAPKRSR